MSVNNTMSLPSLKKTAILKAGHLPCFIRFLIIRIKGNCSVSSQLQVKIHAESPLAMGFLLGCGMLSYGQRSKCADLLNSYNKSTAKNAVPLLPVCFVSCKQNKSAQQQKSHLYGNPSVYLIIHLIYFPATMDKHTPPVSFY